MKWVIEVISISLLRDYTVQLSVSHHFERVEGFRLEATRLESRRWSGDRFISDQKTTQ